MDTGNFRCRAAISPTQRQSTPARSAELCRQTRRNEQAQALTVKSKLTFSASTMIWIRKRNIGKRFMWALCKLLKDQFGVTAVEYALIAALIGVAAIGSMTLVGTRLSTTFSTIASKL